MQCNLTVRPRVRHEPPKFVEKLTTLKTSEGEAIQLRVRAVGDPVPQLTWLKDGHELPCPGDEANMNIQFDDQGGSVITIMRAENHLHDGWYQCTAYNKVGAATTRGRLVVRKPEVLPQQPQPVRINIPKQKRVLPPEYIKEPAKPTRH